MRNHKKTTRKPSEKHLFSQTRQNQQKEHFKSNSSRNPRESIQFARTQRGLGGVEGSVVSKALLHLGGLLRGAEAPRGARDHGLLERKGVGWNLAGGQRGEPEDVASLFVGNLLLFCFCFVLLFWEVRVGGFRAPCSLFPHGFGRPFIVGTPFLVLYRCLILEGGEGSPRVCCMSVSVRCSYGCHIFLSMGFPWVFL